MSRLIVLALLLGASTWCAEPFFFIQLSDPQFGMYAGDRGFAQESANFEFAIAAANRLKPAFVIVTGDLVNKAGAGVLVAEYRRLAARLNPAIPIYNVPGNHDVGCPATPESVSAWRARFGPDYYSFRVGGMAGFVIDSCLMEGEEARRQEGWLRRELADARQAGYRHLVVFTHHPFFLKDPGEPDQYFNIAGAARRRYLDLLHEHGVKYVFAGHLHRNELGRDGDLEMVTTGPVGKPLGAATRSGMRIVKVTDGGISHQYYDFGALPESVDPGR
jgi:serine/threonine-protein phosphatase CPPED1